MHASTRSRYHRSMRSLLPRHIALLLLAVGCGDAGPWGHARHYEPLPDEEGFAARIVPLSYEEAKRFPERHAGTWVGWFGTVEEIAPAANGRVRLLLRYRTHRERHLCAEAAESSCRVTVSERKGAPFVVLAHLRPEQRTGRDRLWKHSLVRAYGPLSGTLDSQLGVPVVEAAYLRHWPVGHYVTTAMRGRMRR